MIMKVAVPLPKHSPMFGQLASSQTVCRLCSRRICLISVKAQTAGCGLHANPFRLFQLFDRDDLIGMRAVFRLRFLFGGGVVGRSSGVDAAVLPARFPVTSVIRSVHSDGHAVLRLGGGRAMAADMVSEVFQPAFEPRRSILLSLRVLPCRRFRGRRSTRVDCEERLQVHFSR